MRYPGVPRGASNVNKFQIIHLFMLQEADFIAVVMALIISSVNINGDTHHLNPGGMVTLNFIYSFILFIYFLTRVCQLGYTEQLEEEIGQSE